MCGVCGVVSFGPRAVAPERAQVERMIDALAHRGPDDSGLESGAEFTLGATRLAIRGLGSGHQPLVDRESGVVAVCNGEIDNHAELVAWLATRGRTVELATDIAVIPGLYLELGDAFVERLEGAFAIALWDPRTSRLVLARDRAGERPLFFLHAAPRSGLGPNAAPSAHGVVFATEMAALAGDPACDLEPDPEAIASYLRFGSFRAPSTPFARIDKVAPAEIVTIDTRGVQRRRWWRWQLGTVAKAEPDEARFDAILRGAVERQSAVDVDFGVFLSGGLDSSLIAAIARDLRPKHTLRGYTLTFAEASYDESDWARRVADALGIESITVPVHAEDMPKILGELVKSAGEPLGDPAWVPTALLARRAAADVKLALVGEGGDELFGGYPTYTGAWLSGLYAKVPKPLRALVARIVHGLPDSEKKVAISFLLKKFVDGAEMSAVARHLLWTSRIPPAMLAQLGCAEPESSDALGVEPVGEALDVVQRFDLESSLAEGLLTKSDRASMRSALELRAPYLDVHVMEFAATLPVRERTRRFETKVFLKRYAQKYLSKDVIYRRKRGLSVPLCTWLRGPLETWARERLALGRLEIAGVNTQAALALFDEHAARRADHSRPLWSLLALAEWTAWVEEEREKRGTTGTVLVPHAQNVRRARWTTTP
jgi:asparagine synthase (glutamine-hydrolysing)